MTSSLPSLGRLFLLTWFLDMEMAFIVMLLVVWLVEASLAWSILVGLGLLLVLSVLEIGQMLSTDLI